MVCACETPKGVSIMSDIGNRCVDCGKDTSFGSGRFVNRIPADADYESIDNEGNIIFAEGEYRDGYLCPNCQFSEEEFEEEKAKCQTLTN